MTTILKMLQRVATVMKQCWYWGNSMKNLGPDLEDQLWYMKQTKNSHRSALLISTYHFNFDTFALPRHLNLGVNAQLSFYGSKCFYLAELLLWCIPESVGYQRILSFRLCWKHTVISAHPSPHISNNTATRKSQADLRSSRKVCLLFTSEFCAHMNPIPRHLLPG